VHGAGREGKGAHWLQVRKGGHPGVQPTPAQPPTGIQTFCGASRNVNRAFACSVPGFLVVAALNVLRSSVRNKSGLDIFNLKPIADVDKSFVPVVSTRVHDMQQFFPSPPVLPALSAPWCPSLQLFCAGRQDAFILPRHSQLLCDSYAGDKEIVLVEGDHNSPRPGYFQVRCRRGREGGNGWHMCVSHHPRSFSLHFPQDRAAIFLRTRMGIPDAYTLDPPLQSWGRDVVSMLVSGLAADAPGQALAGGASFDTDDASRGIEDDDEAAARAILASLGRGRGGGARVELMRSWSDVDRSSGSPSVQSPYGRGAEAAGETRDVSSVAAGRSAVLPSYHASVDAAATDEEAMLQLAIQASLDLHTSRVATPHTTADSTWRRSPVPPVDLLHITANGAPDPRADDRDASASPDASPGQALSLAIGPR
jgi:hypothetical protein